MHPRSRIRYAGLRRRCRVNGVAQPLTRTDGLRAATLPALAAAPHYSSSARAPPRRATAARRRTSSRGARRS
jgi:hypothetical protein